MKNRNWNVIAKMTAIFVVAVSLVACGKEPPSVEQKTKTAALIAKKMPGYEASIQGKVKSESDFASIKDGVWLWYYEKGKDGNIQAWYGYFGAQPGWKALTGKIAEELIGYNFFGTHKGIGYMLDVDPAKGTVGSTPTLDRISRNVEWK